MQYITWNTSRTTIEQSYIGTYFEQFEELFSGTKDQLFQWASGYKYMLFSQGFFFNMYRLSFFSAWKELKS